MTDANETYVGTVSRAEVASPAQCAQEAAGFSSWDENPDRNSGPHIAAFHSAGDQESAPASNSSWSLEHYLENCRRSAQAYSVGKAESDRRARAHLIDVAALVLSDRFDLAEIGKLLDRKVTAPAKKNPFRFVLEALAPGRDLKLVSKQALALQFAVAQSNRNIDQLRTLFQNHSINEFYQNYCNARSEERQLADRSTRPPRMVLVGIPAGLRGEVTVRLLILDGKAQFLATTEVQTVERETVEIPGSERQPCVAPTSVDFEPDARTKAVLHPKENTLTTDTEEGQALTAFDRGEPLIRERSSQDEAPGGIPSVMPVAPSAWHLPPVPRSFGHIGLKPFPLKETTRLVQQTGLSRPDVRLR